MPTTQNRFLRFKVKLAARFQSVIELIDIILQNPAVPSDVLFVNYFRQRRFIGSHDRRAIQDSVYSILRSWPILQFYSQILTGRSAVLWYLRVYQGQSALEIQSLFNGDQYSPSLLSLQEDPILYSSIVKANWPDWVNASVPEWLWPSCLEKFKEHTFVEMQALNQPAGFDIRVNTLKTDRPTVLDQLYAEGFQIVPTSYSPIGIRLDKKEQNVCKIQNQSLKSHRFWQDGYLEVQDEGSQLIALLTDAEPGMAVLDFCAGAGGKTLALAAAMHNKGLIFATDIYDWRLKRAQERLRKANISNVNCQLINNQWLKRQADRFDRVLVDAPCSGTGTWRRNPDLKVRFQPSDLEELLEKQLKILNAAANTVKIGGRLIYATCSILGEENEGQVAKFLQAQPCFSLIPIQSIWSKVLQTICPENQPTLQLTPFRHQTDGFFVSIFEKKA